jgi:hypothetical protein
MATSSINSVLCAVRTAIAFAIARGEPFRVELPKTKTQAFSPKPTKPFFADMPRLCRAS